MMAHRLRVIVAAVAVLVVGSAGWLLVPPERHPAYPPPAGALTAADARQFVARAAGAERVEAADLAVPFAASRVSAFELLIDGPSFYPRILDDLRAARSSIHVVQYGFRPGEVAGR